MSVMCLGESSHTQAQVSKVLAAHSNGSGGDARNMVRSAFEDEWHLVAPCHVPSSLVVAVVEAAIFEPRRLRNIGISGPQIK